jgi:hypothetical protein
MSLSRRQRGPIIAVVSEMDKGQKQIESKETEKDAAKFISPLTFWGSATTFVPH